MTELLLSRELLPPGCTVLCAVSGGADSVCLLDLARRRPELRVLCAHFNHLLRGAESDRDEAFVRDLCAGWGIPCRVGRGDAAAYAREHGMGLEEAARTLRYAFLRETAAAWGADRIATAHTKNDNAETVLLNLARGTGLRGLGGIPPRRGNIVRPLLGVSRAEVEAYLRERDIPHVEDSTNACDDFARNRARHLALPALEALHPGAAENIAAMAATARADEAYLESLAAAFTRRYGTARLPAAELLALPEPVSRRVLRRCAGDGLARKHIEALLDLCRSGGPSAALDLPGRRVRREYGLLVFDAGTAAALPERELRPDGETPLPEAGLVLTAEILTDPREIQSSFNTFCFSCDNICGKLSVASRRAGDALELFGRNGTRSVKKLLIDGKIPRLRRELVPVLRDERGPVAVYGFGQAARVRPAAGERYIKVRIRDEQGRTGNDQ